MNNEATEKKSNMIDVEIECLFSVGVRIIIRVIIAIMVVLSAGDKSFFISLMDFEMKMHFNY